MPIRILTTQPFARTTRAQRHAIKAIWEQDMQTKVSNCRHGMTQTLTPYRAIRRKVQPTFGMDGAVVIYMWGMFIAIEADGYRHS